MRAVCVPESDFRSDGASILKETSRKELTLQCHGAISALYAESVHFITGEAGASEVTSRGWDPSPIVNCFTSEVLSKEP